MYSEGHTISHRNGSCVRHVYFFVVESNVLAHSKERSGFENVLVFLVLQHELIFFVWERPQQTMMCLGSDARTRTNAYTSEL